MKIHIYKPIKFLIVALFIALLSACGGGGGSSEAEEVTLNTLIIDRLEKTLRLDETTQLNVTAYFSDDSSSAVNGQVTWESSDPAIATVSSSGLVTSTAVGNVIISATLKDVTTSVSSEIIQLNSLEISPTSASIAKNSQQQFEATGFYSDNSTEDISARVDWSTNDNAIATIDSSGLLTSVTSGTSVVTANYSGLDTSENILISDADLNQIDIVAPTTLASPITYQLTAIGTYSDGSTQDISQQVTWSSDNENIASIGSNNGLLSTLIQGSVTISASLNSLSSQANISVSSATLSSIHITPQTIDLVSGEEEILIVTAIFSDLTEIDITQSVTWSSSDQSIASIINNNSVKAYSVGNATLTASYLDQTDMFDVSVSNATLDQIVVTPATTLLPIGLNVQFLAIGVYSDNSTADITQQVSWVSDDTSKATISNVSSEAGLATGIASGTVTVTALINSLSQTAQLTVSSAVLQSIEVLPTNQTIAKSTNGEIQAVGHYSDGTEIDITDLVLWSIVDSSIVGLDEANFGVIEGLSDGSSIINASLNNVTGLGQITVSDESLDSLSISVPSNTLPLGNKQSLTVDALFSDASTQDFTTQVTWQSSNSDVIAFDYSEGSEGTVLATGIGSATITASVLDESSNVVSDTASITVSGDELDSVTITVTQTNLTVGSTLQLSAEAEFTSGLTLDVTEEVTWLSSDLLVASIVNVSGQIGLMQALSAGTSEISAIYDSTSSNSVSLTVTQDVNQPDAIELNVFPNVILNDDTDSTVLEATVTPVSVSGSIVDGTTVNFEITEGNSVNVVAATTVGGVASVNYTSSYEGIIVINAEVDGTSIETNSGLYSTSDFANIIVRALDGNVSYDSNTNTLAAGSIFALYIRNLSNRVFDIDAIYVTYGNNASQTNFHDSPITTSEYISDGDLTAGEYAGVGYIVDNNTIGTVFQIVYQLTDPITTDSFLVGTAFTLN